MSQPTPRQAAAIAGIDHLTVMLAGAGNTAFAPARPADNRCAELNDDVEVDVAAIATRINTVA